MRLAERTRVRRNSPYWADCERVCHLFNNMYNSALYDRRQHYRATGGLRTWQQQKKRFAVENQRDYRALPTRVATEALRAVDESYKSFFQLRKRDLPARPPRYKPKGGMATAVFPHGTVSKPKQIARDLYEYALCPRDLNIRFISKHPNIDYVEIQPRGGDFSIIAVRKVEDVPLLKPNGVYASIDFGVNVFTTAFINDGSSVIIPGGIFKSINQYYSKSRAWLSSQLPKGVKTSRRIQALTEKRARKVDTELHTMSKRLVDHFVSREVTTVVVGKNKGWKQSINLGKRNNQNFCAIPHARFVAMLEDKLRRAGIRTIYTEESYTSKCSALDLESVRKHTCYVGRRISRGMFRASNGAVIHADVNAAINIMRKAVSDSVLPEIEDVAVHPVRLNVQKPFRKQKH